MIQPVWSDSQAQSRGRRAERGSGGAGDIWEEMPSDFYRHVKGKRDRVVTIVAGAVVAVTSEDCLAMNIFG